MKRGAVMSNDDKQFLKLRNKWKEVLTGGENINLSDEDVLLKVNEIEREAKMYWNSIQKSEATKSLWSDLSNELPEKNTYESYERLEKMVMAFCIKGSGLRNNEALKTVIFDVLEWLYEKCYNENNELGQEWFYKMGIPMKINNIVIMLYDILPAEMIAKYMKAVLAFSMDSSYHGISTACNRVWRCLVIIMHGIITKSAERISFGIHELLDKSGLVFEYAEEGDGFYKDGSFIQHKDIAYNGGYGTSYIHTLAHILYIIHDSEWDIDRHYYKMFFDIIRNSFVPFIYKGQIMDMTRGREISRKDCTAHKAGHIVTEGIIIATKFADEANLNFMKGMIKYWIEAGTYVSFYKNATVFAIEEAKKIVNDTSVMPGEVQECHKQFIAMDKVVHLRKGYAFAVSMFSDRIANFESINYENIKGWHTGDGMTYLYNNDLSQFDDNYWITVDSKRLPGITVDSGTHIDENHQPKNIVQFKPKYYNLDSFTGGTSVAGRYGVCGINMYSEGCTLSSKKSWFMFDDEIVCLGSDINSSDNRKIETIVENRKVNTNAVLTIDGQSESFNKPWNKSFVHIKWAHLESGIRGADIGYFFPQGGEIETKFESRNGNWAEINEWYGDATNYTRNYISLSFNHGKNPVNQKYAYAILPNKTKEEVKGFALNPSFEIIENSSFVHAVRHNKLNITGANFWHDSVRSAGGITCDRKASIMFMIADGKVELSVSDPTHKNDGYIHVELNLSASHIISLDPRIEVEALSPVIKIKVNVKDAKGSTARIVLGM